MANDTDNVRQYRGVDRYTVSTDAVGTNPTVQVQHVKLLDGTDGSSTPITGSGGSLSVSEAKAATSVTSTVAASATSVTLLAANSNRVEAIVWNDSTAILRVKFGATASSTDYTVLLNENEAVIVDTYTGILDGIWDSATGNARITELTP
jgi:hypothetical protein